MNVKDLERALTARGLTVTTTNKPGQLRVQRPGTAAMLGETITMGDDGAPYWSWGNRVCARGDDRAADDNPAAIADRIDRVITGTPVSNSI